MNFLGQNLFSPTLLFCCYYGRYSLIEESKSQGLLIIQPRPYRVCFGTGDVSRNLGDVVKLQGEYGREIPGGAGQMLEMPLNPKKRLKHLTMRTLSNDVVIGLMALTLQ